MSAFPGAIVSDLSTGQIYQTLANGTRNGIGPLIPAMSPSSSGTTNRLALQSAIVNAAAIGASVFIPAGAYTVDASIPIIYPSNTVMHGVRGQSILMPDLSTVPAYTVRPFPLINSVFIGAGNPTSGYRAAQPFASGPVNILPGQNGAGSVNPATVVTDCHFSDFVIIPLNLATYLSTNFGSNVFLSGLSLIGAYDSTIENVECYGLPNDGIEAFITNVKIRKCKGWINGYSGGSSGQSTTRNGLTNCGWFDVTTPWLTSRGAEIIDCDFSYNANEGIAAGGGAGVKILGNKLYGNFYNAIEGDGGLSQWTITAWQAGFPAVSSGTPTFFYVGGNIYQYTAPGTTAANKTITAITQANPGVITSASHGFANGNLVFIPDSIVGMTELNSSAFLISGATTNTFTLTDLLGNAINTTAFNAYVSGGLVALAPQGTGSSITDGAATCEWVGYMDPSGQLPSDVLINDNDIDGSIPTTCTIMGATYTIPGGPGFGNFGCNWESGNETTFKWGSCNKVRNIKSTVSTDGGGIGFVCANGGHVDICGPLLENVSPASSAHQILIETSYAAPGTIPNNTGTLNINGVRQINPGGLGSGIVVLGYFSHGSISGVRSDAGNAVGIAIGPSAGNNLKKLVIDDIEFAGTLNSTVQLNFSRGNMTADKISISNVRGYNCNQEGASADSWLRIDAVTGTYTLTINDFCVGGGCEASYGSAGISWPISTVNVPVNSIVNFRCDGNRLNLGTNNLLTMGGTSTRLFSGITTICQNYFEGNNGLPGQNITTNVNSPFAVGATQGNYAMGDISIQRGGYYSGVNGIPPGGAYQWVITASGTIGTLNSGATTGTTDGVTRILVVNSATGLAVRQQINIAGVSNGPFMVCDINGLNIGLNVVPNATVSAAAISFAAGAANPVTNFNGPNQKNNSNTATGSTTLTGANIAGGNNVVYLNLTGTLGGAANAQLPTVAALITAIGQSAFVGQSYTLRVINESSANFAWTVTTNTGWSLTGTMTIAQGAWRDFEILLTSVTSATAQLNNQGGGAY